MQNQALSTPEKTVLNWSKVLKPTPPSVAFADGDHKMMMDGMQRFIYRNNTRNHAQQSKLLCTLFTEPNSLFTDEKKERVEVSN